MGRLIVSEFKKVFKSKINIALLVIMVLFCGYMNVQKYNSNSLNYVDSKIIMNKKELSNQKLNKQLDQDATKLQGTMNDAKIEKRYEEYTKLMEASFVGDTIDTKKMENQLGSDYATYLEKIKNNALTEDEFFEQYCLEGCEYRYDEEKENIIYPIYYQNDGLRRYYNSLYWNVSYNTSILTKEDIQFSPVYILTHRSEFLYPKGANVSTLFFNRGETDKAKEDKVFTYLSEKVANQSSTYYSTLPNYLFLENLQTNFNVFFLIVLAIILANTFAREAYYKTDQIIVPSKVGNTKITIAKCISALCIAIGMLLVQFLLAFIIACVKMPIHDLQAAVFSQQGIYSQIFEYAFTYREVLIQVICISVACTFICTMGTLALSYFTRNRFATIIPIMLMLLVPMFVPIFMLCGNSSLDYLFPGRASMFLDLFSGSRPYLVMGDSVIPMLWVAGALFIIIGFILFIAMIMHSRKHIVKNC